MKLSYVNASDGRWRRLQLQIGERNIPPSVRGWREEDLLAAINPQFTD